MFGRKTERPDWIITGDNLKIWRKPEGSWTIEDGVVTPTDFDQTCEVGSPAYFGTGSRRYNYWFHWRLAWRAFVTWLKAGKNQ